MKYIIQDSATLLLIRHLVQKTSYSYSKFSHCKIFIESCSVLLWKLERRKDFIMHERSNLSPQHKKAITSMGGEIKREGEWKCT